MYICFIILALTAWIPFSIISYGAYYAYFVNEFPSLYVYFPWRKSEIRKDALFFASFGPVSFVSVIMVGGFKHGLQFKGGPKR